MYLNNVQLVGRLCHTPSKYIKVTPAGMKVLSISIAQNRTYKDKDGNKIEKPLFHDLVFYGRTAEVLAQYALKGQEILVTGRLETRTWDKKDGTKGYKTEVIVEDMQLGQKPLNLPQKDGVDPEWSNEPSQEVNEQPEAKQTANTGIEYPTEDINPEDIPF